MDLPRTKQSHVYTVLREDIKTGRLKPGTKLTLVDLCERFEMSHIPIREALRNLEKEDLIEAPPHVTPFVKGISSREALWVIEMRITLEPLAAAEATKYLGKAELEKLEQLVLQMDEVVAKKQPEHYLELSFDFHKLIYSATPNPYLAKTLHELAETFYRYTTVTGQYQQLALWQAEHHELLEALKAKKPQQVKNLMCRHLLQVKDLLEEIHKSL